MKALVVDDDATNRLVLKGLLTKESFTVVVAENGQQAIDKYHEENPDIILMDVMMPVMDGYEATRRIKAESGENFVPIIFLTAMSGDEALVSCLENGGDDYLNKPINRTVLVAKINAMQRIRALNETVVTQTKELSLYKQRIEHEQEVAEKIFNNIVVRGDIDIPIINSYRKSAESFNGDIVLSVREPGNGVNILVGDFTGHGLAAAIGAMPVAEIFYAMSKKGWEIGDIVSEINKKIGILLPGGRFLAACVMHVDSRVETITIWNGGMPEVMIVDTEKQVVRETLYPEHVPLGVYPPQSFDKSVQRINVSRKDKILVFSDGVTETVDSTDTMFGSERLEQIIAKHNGKNSLIDEIVSAIDTHRGDQEQLDDVTLLEIDCKPERLFSQKSLEPRTGSRRRRSNNWGVEFTYKNDALRLSDPVPELIDAIRKLGGGMDGVENLFVIFSELYNNALDHGVLGLASDIKTSAEGFELYYKERKHRLETLAGGWIKVMIESDYSDDDLLVITISDSGKGFNASEKAESNNELLASGRGLALLGSLCEDIAFNEDGTQCRVLYRVE